MKLWILAENTACAEGMLPEHGLSLYMETGSRRILFDMGQTDAFARNAARMGVNLEKVDTAVLSHGHYDHGGGMAAFLHPELDPLGSGYAALAIRRAQPVAAILRLQR